MNKFFAVYRECIKVSFARITAYRLNFVLTCIITLVGNILFPLVTVLIYSSGASFPNWGLFEVLLIQSIFTMSSGIASVLFDGVLWATMDLIREGSFETVLLKPINPIVFLMATTFEPESFGLVIGGLVIFIVSLCNIGAVTISMFAHFLVLFAAGVAVMLGFSMIMAAVSFKWVGNSRIPEIFNSIKAFGQYPVSIFPKAIRSFSTFIIPVAMIGCFPASALLGNVPDYAYISVLPCILFMFFGIWLYQKMIKLYQGVGG